MSKGNRARRENQHRALRGEDYHEAPLASLTQARPRPEPVHIDASAWTGAPRAPVPFYLRGLAVALMLGVAVFVGSIVVLWPK